MYDKRKEFKEEIREKLNELKTACHMNGIPFMFAAVVSDDGAETEYEMDGITPGSINLVVSDDRVKRALNVLNGLEGDVMYKTTVEDLSYDDGLADEPESDEEAAMMAEEIEALRKR